MKKVGMLLLSMLLLLSGCSQKKENISDKQDFEMMIVSDIHYLSPSYYENCSWFGNSLLDGDGKITQYSSQVVDSFVKEVISQKPDLVLITGDLTFNGEKLSHEELAKALQPIREKGIEIAIINGNHDVDNEFARDFKENGALEVDSVDAPGFKTCYKNDGYHLAKSEDNNSLSYRISLNPQYDLILLDTNAHQLNAHTNYQQGSYISDETMAWLNNELAVITANHKKAIVAMHHNLAIHSEALYEGYTVDNYEALSELLTKYQVPLTLSGHIHAQNIAKIADIYDICTGSLTISPIQYGKLTLHEDGLDYQTGILENIQGDEDFYMAASYQRMKKRLADQVDEELAKKLASYVAEINLYYFAGTLANHIDELKARDTYQLIQENGEALGFLADHIDQMLADRSTHTTLHLTY